jgi:hypothetical protein
MPIVPPEQLPIAAPAHAISVEAEDRHAPHPSKELIVEVTQGPIINQTIDSAGNIQGGVMPPPVLKIKERDPL